MQNHPSLSKPQNKKPHIKYHFFVFIDAAQEVLESLKDRWFQADTNPTDQLLNEQEFLSFLHPEHSRGMLKYMVKEIIRDLGTS